MYNTASSLYIARREKADTNGQSTHDLAIFIFIHPKVSVASTTDEFLVSKNVDNYVRHR
jgi:hypothetical protein